MLSDTAASATGAHFGELLIVEVGCPTISTTASAACRFLQLLRNSFGWTYSKAEFEPDKQVSFHHKTVTDLLMDAYSSQRDAYGEPVDPDSGYMESIHDEPGLPATREAMPQRPTMPTEADFEAAIRGAVEECARRKDDICERLHLDVTKPDDAFVLYICYALEKIPPHLQRAAKLEILRVVDRYKRMGEEWNRMAEE
ncbi:uncharacterized protein ISCGN_007275 [Ixodes scapularis]